MEQQDLHRENEDGIRAQRCEKVGGEGWKWRGGSDGAGDRVRCPAAYVGGVIEEEDVYSGEADEGVDVEEEDAIEQGDVRHFG